jgi:hypothetical protein
MMSDPYPYTFECPSCDCNISLTVYDCDELPIFCPMCGDDMNGEWDEKED